MESQTSAQQTQLDGLLELLRSNRFMPPSIRELKEAAGAELTAVLLERGEFTKVNQDLYFLKDAYEEMVSFVQEHIRNRGRLAVGELRDRFGMTRKYILPFLDHLDARRITRRIGDDRVLAEDE